MRIIVGGDAVEHARIIDARPTKTRLHRDSRKERHSSKKELVALLLERRDSARCCRIRHDRFADLIEIVLVELHE